MSTSRERLICPLGPHHDNFLGEITSISTFTRGDTQVPRWPDNPLLISPISNSDDATKRLLYWGRAVTPRYFVPGPPERGRRRGREALGDSKWGEGQPKSSSSYSYSQPYSPHRSPIISHSSTHNLAQNVWSLCSSSLGFSLQAPIFSSTSSQGCFHLQSQQRCSSTMLLSFHEP